MEQIFAPTNEFIEMLPEEIEKVLENEAHETRAGALSIMDKQGHSKKTPESRRKELFDLYLRRTDKIDNWDLVDLGAPHVIRRYLFDRTSRRRPIMNDIQYRVQQAIDQLVESGA